MISINPLHDSRHLRDSLSVNSTPAPWFCFLTLPTGAQSLCGSPVFDYYPNYFNEVQISEDVIIELWYAMTSLSLSSSFKVTESSMNHFRRVTIIAQQYRANPGLGFECAMRYLTHTYIQTDWQDSPRSQQDC